MTARPLPAVLPTAALAAAGQPLVAAWLAGRSPRTLAAYRSDLDHFGAWVGQPTLDGAAARLVGAGAGPANALALAYRGAMLDAGLAPATVNRRLAALRSLVQLARTVGQADFILDVPNVPSRSFRDTRGPGPVRVRTLLDALARPDTPKAARDVALVRCLADLALRVSEAVGLDVADVEADPDGAPAAVWIRGKGRRGQRERLTLPAPTREVLAVWLAQRGQEPGPLFTSAARDPRWRGHRLTDRSVRELLARFGIRPHGLRHTDVTAALEAGADLRDVRRFARHASVQTTMIYDDARRDTAGAVASVVAGQW